MNEFYFFSHCYRSQSGMRLNLCFYDPIYSMAPGTWGPPAARLQQRYSVTEFVWDWTEPSCNAHFAGPQSPQ